MNIDYTEVALMFPAIPLIMNVYSTRFGAFGFLFNMVTVFALYLDELFIARIIFGSCCLSMMTSIIFFIREIQISTRALRLHISDMDQQFKE